MHDPETTTHPPTRVAIVILAVLLSISPPVQADEPESEARRPDLLQSGGGFASVWNRQFFIGPGALPLERLIGGGTPLHRLPADFEPHEAVVLAGGKLAEQYPSLLASILGGKGKGGQSPFCLIVSSGEEEEHLLELLRKNDISRDRVRVVRAPTDTIWVRDFGPVFVFGPDGSLGAIDPSYGRSREKDDSVPKVVAAAFDVPIIETELIWEGGNLLSNGRGLLLTTTQSINANVESGRDAKTAFAFLKNRLGIRQVVVLEHLRGEKTGHVDMFACFTAPDTVLVGDYDESIDPINAGVLNRNAARLAQVRIGEEHLKVIRIPMPSNDDGVWRTYTNVLFAGKTVFVPTCPDVKPTLHRKAIEVLRASMPDREIVCIDAEALLKNEGGLRCICDYVPRGGRGEEVTKRQSGKVAE